MPIPTMRNGGDAAASASSLVFHAMSVEPTKEKQEIRDGVTSVALDAPFKSRWDTSNVPARERFSYFREGVCQAFLAFSPFPPADGSLRATIDSAVLDKGVVSRIDTSPLKVTRTATDFSRIPGDLYSLGWSPTGGLEGTAAGKPFVQGKNQLTLVTVDTIENFDLVPCARYSTVSVIFEKARLRDVGVDHQVLVLNRRHDAALTTCMKLIDKSFERASRPQLNCLMDAAISLLNARLIQDPNFFEESMNGFAAEGLILAIKDFICHHITESELTTEYVASHFGISARYIQKLFAENKTTFKATVVRLRLDRVATDLADPKLAKMPVSDIAFRWGFRDLATFHRNFRRQFDDTPNRMRPRRELIQKLM